MDELAPGTHSIPLVDEHPGPGTGTISLEGGAVLVDDADHAAPVQQDSIAFGGLNRPDPLELHDPGMFREREPPIPSAAAHPRCFTIWLAGGGIRGGVTIGETDDFSYNIVKDPVHVHDLNATILHCMGIDHKALTFRYQVRDFRLTDVHGNVVKAMLA